MKYIIDVPDEGKYRLGQEYIFANDGERIAVSCNLADLTPYTEPDRKVIEDEVWDFASMLMNMHHDVAEDIYWSMNGGKGIEVAAEMTYQEAKSKYEAWKAKKDEIRVGDEVEIAGTTGVVVGIPKGDEQRVHYITPSGKTYCNNAYADIIKTGRYFPEVAELLKKMKKESYK